MKQFKLIGQRLAANLVLQIGTNVANPIDEDDIFGDAEQIQLTNMRASAVELRARG